MAKNLNNVKPFDKKLQNIRIDFASAIKDIAPKASFSLASCGDSFARATYENLETNAKIQRLHARFCKSRFCMICNKNRQLRMLARWLPVMDKLSSSAYNDLDFIFMTLTIPNPLMPNLRYWLDRMSKAFSHLYNELLKPRGFKGFIRSVEYLGDFTPVGYAHPHYHIIFAVDKDIYYKQVYSSALSAPNGFDSIKQPNYIDKDKLRDIWLKSLNIGKYKGFPVKSIQGVEIGKIRSKNIGLECGSAVAGLLETLKYCAKGSSLKNLSNEAKKELYKQTKSTKLIHAGGIFRHLLRDLNLDKDDISLDSKWRLILIEWFRFNNISLDYDFLCEDSTIRDPDYFSKSRLYGF